MSDNITAEPLSSDGTLVVGDVNCESCHRTWGDVYALIKVEEKDDAGDVVATHELPRPAVLVEVRDGVAEVGLD